MRHLSLATLMALTALQFASDGFALTIDDFENQDFSISDTTTADGLVTGFDFNSDLDGIWWEGTAQMALAFKFLDQETRAAVICQSMRKHSGSITHPGAVMAVSIEPLTTGFQRMSGEDWVYWRRAHVGATCWYLFAEDGWNPYWGEPLAE